MSGFVRSLGQVPWGKCHHLSSFLLSWSDHGDGKSPKAHHGSVGAATAVGIRAVEEVHITLPPGPRVAIARGLGPIARELGLSLGLSFPGAGAPTVLRPRPFQIVRGTACRLFGTPSSRCLARILPYRPGPLPDSASVPS